MYLHIGDGEEVRGADLVGIFAAEVVRSEENEPFRKANGIDDTGGAARSYIVLENGVKTSVVAPQSIAARGKDAQYFIN